MLPERVPCSGVSAAPSPGPRGKSITGSCQLSRASGGGAAAASARRGCTSRWAPDIGRMAPSRVVVPAGESFQLFCASPCMRVLWRQWYSRGCEARQSTGQAMWWRRFGRTKWLKHYRVQCAQARPQSWLPKRALASACCTHFSCGRARHTHTPHTHMRLLTVADVYSCAAQPQATNGRQVKGSDRTGS